MARGMSGLVKSDIVKSLVCHVFIVGNIYYQRIKEIHGCFLVYLKLHFSFLFPSCLPRANLLSKLDFGICRK